MNPAFLTFFISICEYNRAFYEMFQAQMNRIDEMSTVANKNMRQDADIREALCETISFHIAVKE